MVWQKTICSDFFFLSDIEDGQQCAEFYAEFVSSPTPLHQEFRHRHQFVVTELFVRWTQYTSFLER